MSGHLTKNQLEELKNDLLELKERLRNEIMSYSGEVANTTYSGRNTTDSTHDDDFAEAGSETYEKERDLALVESLRVQLDRVEQSLARMESGDYGVCANCGADIPFERLKAIPYTDRCLECKKREA